MLGLHPCAKERTLTGPDATLAAAIVAAIVASVGLLWSVVSFFITRSLTKTTTARSEWRSRFENAHALALSADPNEARTGALLMKSLSTEKWVTDADRATTASVLLALPAGVSEPEKVREVLATMQDRKVAAVLASVRPGPKGRFEIYTDKAGAWRWRMKAENGDLIAVAPEGYSSRDAALIGMQAFRPGPS